MTDARAYQSHRDRQTTLNQHYRHNTENRTGPWGKEARYRVTV
jgi:hypothetical protein